MAARLPPLLVALPQGLTLGGVTSWALRLAEGWAVRGGAIGLVVHRSNAEVPSSIEEAASERAFERRGGRSPLAGVEGVEVFPITGTPPIGSCCGDDSGYLPVYLAAVDSLAARGGVPVVALPNLSAECYGLIALLTRERPGVLRVVAWTHNDIAHDYRLAEHYEPTIARFAGVSERIVGELRRRLPGRACDIAHLPYGVAVPAAAPARPALDGRPLRLVYAGRLDHFQKRVAVLPILSRRLAERGIAHELTVIGDGPARDDLSRAAAGMTMMRVLLPADLSAVAAHFARADLFVLPSRFEGLSVSMLEAMAQGCVPVVARTASGAAEAIVPGVSGEIVDASVDDEALASAMADAVARAAGRGLEAMSRAAWGSARERFTVVRHLDAAAALISAAACSAPRDWPTDRRCAPNNADGTGFNVPHEARTRARVALEALAGRRIALWGAGRHTAAIAAELPKSPASVVALIDDDPANRGGSLAGQPIVSAEEAARLGATDVLISSAIHERSMWARRTELERLGLRVHRMYESESTAPERAPPGESACA